MTINTPADRLPRYTPGSHVQLPDGTTATVLTQRGTTVWLTHDDGDPLIARADQLPRAWHPRSARGTEQQERMTTQ